MPRLGRHELLRAHALGNDYLVVDAETFGIALTPERIRRITDRHRGVGSDGILELVPPPPGFDAAVRVHNPDGSEAEKSGNGARIFAKACEDHGYTAPGRPIRIHTRGGEVTAVTVERTGTQTRMRVSMGRVSFRIGDLPMVVPGLEEGARWTRRVITTADGGSWSATCLSVGNPHVVIFGAPVDEEAARRIGPQVERHPYFPARTNVQLAEVLGPREVRAVIWERGAGYTLASGSSACAVAAAAVEAGLVERDVEVSMPGGALSVSIGADWSIEQVGPAQELARVLLSPDLLAELLRLAGPPGE